MSYIFDGKNFALEKEEKLKLKVDALKKKGIFPKLISIIIGDDPASHLYVNLKKKAGERVGVEVEVINLASEINVAEITDLINSLNEDDKVHGIMVQLPLPEKFSSEDKEAIINTILPEKDVDGLRNESKFIHPTSKAILEILDFSLTRVYPLQNKPRCKVLVVGSTGMVGKPLVKELRIMNFELSEADSSTKNLRELCINSDVLISTTGVPELIKSDMVKDSAILIDVGSPRGDIEKSAYEKASFVSPVPGGVGPVTIMCLLENLIDASNY